MNTINDDKAKKKIKDPLYGYIPVDMKYIKDIVDTPVFQRLRRVIQTSYSPLYSSTLHNRFVHSLGVFYLGSIAANRLKTAILEEGCLNNNKLVKKPEDYVENLVNIFLIACLLHDIGHAPFSHTGEIYYKNYITKDDEGKEDEEHFDAFKLHNKLRELLDSVDFNKDIPADSESAAPHELMSAIVGMEVFGNMIGENEDKEFFTRCITGYKYENIKKVRKKVNKKFKNEDSEDDKRVKAIKNCFISMLNSKVIDVDRLDYLIRDAYTSGFATINIDYIRLLNALTIKECGGKFQLVYQKDAISVIENVLYAHDAERKWIQNHPVVLYEAYIIKHILENLSKKLDLDQDEKKLFSKGSLSQEGHKLNNDVNISLLCDDDIIFLSKNMLSDDALSKELFDRNKRRHPVWKSEAEYKAYISSAPLENVKKKLFNLCMTRSFNASCIPEHPVPIVINEEFLKKVREDSTKNTKNALKRSVFVCEYLEGYANEHGFPFDYIIIPTSIFTSNFSKDHLSKVLVNFEGKEQPEKLGEVCNLLKSNKSDDDKDFYYLFYRRGEAENGKPGKIEDVCEFCTGLINACLKDD